MVERRLEVAAGVALAVRTWDGGGRGQAPFLLVHGLASNARLWDGVAEELARAGHPVAAPDQRGHGRSDKPDDGYDFATVAADLAAVIEGLGLDRPVVAGQSWGGNVVLELAARRPELVRGVVAVDGGTMELATRFALWDDCLAALTPPRLAGTPRADMESMVRAMHPDWPEAGIQGALACFEVRPDGTVAPWLTLDRHLRILRAMWEQHLTALYPQVAVPVLLLPCHDGSPWTEAKRADVARAEKALPVVRVEWFEADHDVHAQRPAEVAAAMLGALDEGFFP
jgi:pimeloyl-ACP methyl ester carboxylesterase